MVYNAIRCVLEFVRALSHCLGSLDQTAVIDCGGRHVRLGPGIGDTCGGRSFDTVLDHRMTVAELRDQLTVVEKYLIDILALVHRG